MALLLERPCCLRPRSWAFVGAVVLQLIPEGLARGIVMIGLVVLLAIGSHHHPAGVAFDRGSIVAVLSIPCQLGTAIAVLFAK
jgi:hypothetical protein